MMRTVVMALTAVATFTAPARAEWPDRPIKLIVPFTAGSSSDTIARLIAAKVGDRLNQQIVVENRVGGSTVIGTDAVAKSAPDGYTLGPPAPRPSKATSRFASYSSTSMPAIKCAPPTRR